MKRTIATLMAAGLILPIAGVVTASQLQAQAKTSAIGSILAQTDDRPTRSERDEPGEHLERLAADLGLTEDQVAQMRTIREANQEEMQALRENIRTERETLQALMAGEAS
ncbi:MAG: Spy/CpxP family protein refolding chaperone, partial [Cyanobacteria bacterium J06636_16]